ncbi:MAG: M14 family zinc carboxypeptidase [Acidovorax sp.]|nr:M14 family zinc carboxypeptidase [Acidovorax sp.]
MWSVAMVSAVVSALAAMLWVPTQLWPGFASPGAVYGRVHQGQTGLKALEGRALGPGAGAVLDATPSSDAREPMNAETPPSPAAIEGASDASAVSSGAEMPASTAAIASGLAGQATQEACDKLLARLPGVSRAQCLATQLQPSGATSSQGVPLYWRDVAQRAGAPAPAGDAPPLRVLVVGAMHGDELTAASLALRWIGLAGAEGGDRAAPQPPVHWRFIPVLNPDGLLAPKPTRVNASGVDLNRNFPTPGWAQDAPVYWEKRTRKDPRRWPGHTPLSEPESRFLHQQMEQFQPQLVVSIHAPYGVLDFDGPHDPPARLGRLRMDKLGVFPGSLGHYGGLHRGVPVVTIELDHALRMPPDAEVRAMWRDLRQWMNTRLRDGGDAVAGVAGAEPLGVAR